MEPATGLSVAELRKLLYWADTAHSNRAFWRRIWWAAAAYDARRCALLRGFVAQIGYVPGGEVRR